MSFGGNIKQRACMWAAIVFFAVSALFGFQFLVSGHLGDRGIAIGAMVLAFFGLAGMWTMGLERRPDDDEEDEWDTIK